MDREWDGRERRRSEIKLDKLEDEFIELEGDLKTHIVQCDERWKTNFARLESIDGSLRRVENRLLAGVSTLIVFLAGLVVALIKGSV